MIRLLGPPDQLDFSADSGYSRERAPTSLLYDQGSRALIWDRSLSLQDSERLGLRLRLNFEEERERKFSRVRPYLRCSFQRTAGFPITF